MNKKLISKILLGSMIMPLLMLGNTATYAIHSEPEIKTGTELAPYFNFTNELNKEISLKTELINALHRDYPNVQTIEVFVCRYRIDELLNENLLQALLDNGIKNIRVKYDDYWYSDSYLEFLQRLKIIYNLINAVNNKPENSGKDPLKLELPKILHVLELSDENHFVMPSRSFQFHRPITICLQAFIAESIPDPTQIKHIVVYKGIKRILYFHNIENVVKNLKRYFPNLESISDLDVKTAGEYNIKERNDDVSGVKVFVGINNPVQNNNSENEKKA